jgi:hypothetical protein
MTRATVVAGMAAAAAFTTLAGAQPPPTAPAFTAPTALVVTGL